MSLFCNEGKNPIKINIAMKDSRPQAMLLLFLTIKHLENARALY